MNTKCLTTVTTFAVSTGRRIRLYMFVHFRPGDINMFGQKTLHLKHQRQSILKKFDK